MKNLKPFSLFLMILFFSNYSGIAQQTKSPNKQDRFGIQFASTIIEWSGFRKHHSYFEGGLFYQIPLSKRCWLVTNVIYNRSIDKKMLLTMEDINQSDQVHRYFRDSKSSKIKIPLQLKYALNKKSSIYMLLGFSTGFHFGMSEEIEYRDTNPPGIIVEDPPLYEDRDNYPILLIQDTEFFHQKIIEQFELAFGFKFGDLYLEPSFKYERNHYGFLHPIELRVKYCLLKQKSKT